MLIATLLNAFKIIFLLGFLVFIHEGGHFIVAKKSGVKVEAFSVGFGPKIYKKQIGETTYSVGLLPFGGYVQMDGENERNDNPRSFCNAKLYKRLAIVFAGPIVNIIFGIIAFFILSLVSGYNMSTTIDTIMPEATSSIEYLKSGDKVVAINGKPVRIKSDIDNNVRSSNGETLEVKVLRDGQELIFNIKPLEYQEGIYLLGIKVHLAETDFNSRVYYSFWSTVEFTGSFFESVKMLFTGQVSVKQMTGPIGISEMVVNQKEVYDFVYLLCMISLSLGITNLLPIPALDGGRILILIIEGIRGKALKEEVELEIQSIGFTMLILFSLYVSYQDILRIF